jgi:hypothetical protein
MKNWFLLLSLPLGLQFAHSQSSELCKTQVESQNWAGAVTACNQAINSNTQDADSWLNRGMASYNLGDMSAALRDMSKAISLSPRMSLAYYNRGLIYDALAVNDLRACTDWDAAFQLGDKDAAELLLSETCKGKKYATAKLPAENAAPALKMKTIQSAINPVAAQVVAPAVAAEPVKKTVSAFATVKKTTLADSPDVFKSKVAMASDVNAEQAENSVKANILIQALNKYAPLADTILKDSRIELGKDECRALLLLSLKVVRADAPSSQAENGKTVMTGKSQVIVDREFLGKAALTVNMLRADWAEWTLPITEWDKTISKKALGGDIESAYSGYQMTQFIDKFKAALVKNF